MNALREVYDFITGGSVAAPIALAAAIVVTALLPRLRAEAFVALVLAGFIASTLERPN